MPGNLAGALALEAAGPRAARVRVGYFVSGDPRRSASAGTRASMLGVQLPGCLALAGQADKALLLALEVTGRIGRMRDLGVARAAFEQAVAAMVRDDHGPRAPA